MTRHDRSTGGRRRARWRWAPAVAAAIVGATMLPGSAAPCIATVVPTAVKLPADCVPTPHPPPTEYGFVARVTGGTVTGDRMKVTDMDVSVCGVIRVVNATPGSNCTGIQGELIIPADGVVTNGLKAQLTVIPGSPIDIPVEVTATPMASYVRCDGSSGGLKMDLNMKVRGSAGGFGLACQVPFTGTVHSTVTGPLLTPPYEGNTTITGKVDAGQVANNDKYCPGQLPGRVNKIADLPTTGYDVNWPTKVSIYHPATS